MADTSKHLTSFKVENFKRFESFEMNDLGQFNLIVGDNNVGKTSVLEALLVDEDADVTIHNLLTALAYRNLITGGLTFKDILLYSNVKRKDSFRIIHTLKDNDNTPINFISVGSQRNKLEFYSSRQNTPAQKFGLNDGFVPNSNIDIPFIPFHRGHDEDLTRFYGELQADRPLKSRFLKSLQIIVPTIDDIELTLIYEKPHIIVYQSHIDQSLPLAFFGDGLLKLFRLLAAIIINKGHRLMIDEIDTGIHYSRFKEFWKTLLIAAIDNDVQLFMTTHNEECIKYFVEVFSEEELLNHKEDARSITLIESPDETKSVKAFTYNYDGLRANLVMENEIRGGSR
jgi:predicted ATPase